MRNHQYPCKTYMCLLDWKLEKISLWKLRAFSLPMQLSFIKVKSWLVKKKIYFQTLNKDFSRGSISLCLWDVNGLPDLPGCSVLVWFVLFVVLKIWSWVKFSGFRLHPLPFSYGEVFCILMVWISIRCCIFWWPSDGSFKVEKTNLVNLKHAHHSQWSRWCL